MPLYQKYENGKIPFSKDEKFEVVSVDGRPYLFTEEHVEYSTLPKGMHAYELSDYGSDGRPNRLSTKVKGYGFYGTIIGRHYLPLGNDKQYYLEMDSQFDEDKDNYYIQKVRDFLDEEGAPSYIYDSLVVGYEQNHKPNDEFFSLKRFTTFEEYMDRYGEFCLRAADRATAKGKPMEYAEIKTEADLEFYYDLPVGGTIYFLDEFAQWDIGPAEGFNLEELKEAMKNGYVGLTYISGQPIYDKEALRLIRDEYFENPDLFNITYENTASQKKACAIEEQQYQDDKEEHEYRMEEEFDPWHDFD